MKKLMIAMAVCATSLIASAVINSQEGFEGETDWTTTGGTNATYAGDAPSVGVYNYPFLNAGSKYLDVNADTEAPVASPSVSGSTYVDMWVQFETRDDYDEDEIAGAKLAVYLNSASNIVVLSGTDTNKVDNTTAGTIIPGSWHRLTIAQVGGGFNVFVDNTKLTYNDGENAAQDVFPAITEGDMSRVGFYGKGAVDNFVARTTDPFIPSPAAMIAGEGYASLDAALDELTAATNVTLCAHDLTTAKTLAAGDSYKIALNGFRFGGFTGADGVVVTASEPVDGVTTYTGVDGVAAVNGTWYASFAEAYDAAAASGDALTVKIAADFTPVFSSEATAKTFTSITFTNTVSSALSIATTDGALSLVAPTWVAPVNATLTLGSSQSVTSVTAGTFVVPENVTLDCAASVFGSGDLFSNLKVQTLRGTGRLKFTGAYPEPLAGYVMQDSNNWWGTCEIYNVNAGDGSDASFSAYGNSASTLCLNFVQARLGSASFGSIGTIEIGSQGLTVWGQFADTDPLNIASKLIGTGAINITATTASGTKSICFTGDASEFAGGLSNSSAVKVVFGPSTTAGNGACISIANGMTVTVAANRNWNSQNGFVVLGTLNVAGTLKHQGGSAAGQIYGAQTTGRIVYKNAAAITTFGGSYKGEIVIDGIVAGDTSTQVPLAFGCTDAKLTLNGVSGNAWCAGSTYTNQTEVTIAGDVNFQNGYSNKEVIFRKIAAGTGNLSLKTWSGCQGITYGFITLDADNYTGTIQLDGNKMTFKVGNILKVGAAAGDKVLPLTVANDAIVDLSAAQLNGEAAELEVKDDGVYVKDSTPEEPTIDPSSNTPTADVTGATDEDDAIDKAKVAAPEAAGSTPEAIAAYKDLFTYSAVQTGEGAYTVTLTGIKEDVKEDVNDDALTALVTAAADTEATTVSVDVPAGLYYKVTTFDTLDGAARATQSGISDGTGTTPVLKPTSATQGFIKVEIGTKAFN